MRYSRYKAVSKIRFTYIHIIYILLDTLETCKIFYCDMEIQILMTLAKKIKYFRNKIYRKSVSDDMCS